jgi:DNA helicase-2/ATP-dependent DNA helicase PcrA
MCLNVPQYSMLDEDQRRVYLLPFTGRNLVTGPPGTGKSVIAIHRAAAMAKRGKTPTVLMFNKLLQLWTAKALEEAGKMAELKASALKELESKTTEAWFKLWFQETFGVPAPTKSGVVTPSKTMTTRFGGKCEVCGNPTLAEQDLAVKYGSERFCSVHPNCLPQLNERKSETAYKSVDFGKCLEIAESEIEGVPENKRKLNILIDEGQDLPNNAYVLLSEFCESITVYLDSAQTITENRSTEDEIVGLLEIEESRKQILRKNYRNGKEVHQLAEKFRPGYIEVGDTPERKCTDVPKLIGFASAAKEAEWISTLARNYSNLSIGVFTRLKNQRDTISNKLKESGVKFQVYEPERRGREFDPCRKGITLATQANAKGLEFDIVVVAGMEQWPSDIPDYLYGQFYVLITRSRDRLFLSYVGNSESDLPKMLTSDRFKPLIEEHLIVREFRT